MKIEVAENRIFKSSVEYLSSSTNEADKFSKFTFIKKLTEEDGKFVKVEEEINIYISDASVTVSVSDEAVMMSRMRQQRQPGVQQASVQPTRTVHNVTGQFTALKAMVQNDAVEQIGTLYVRPLYPEPEA
jgi:hypothetical protein